MRAYISRYKRNESIPEVGMSNRFITGEYKSLKALIRYGVKSCTPLGSCARIELYYNWDNRYAEPDKVYYLDADGMLRFSKP